MPTRKPVVKSSKPAKSSRGRKAASHKPAARLTAVMRTATKAKTSVTTKSVIRKRAAGSKATADTKSVRKAPNKATSPALAKPTPALPGKLPPKLTPRTAPVMAAPVMATPVMEVSQPSAATAPTKPVAASPAAARIKSDVVTAIAVRTSVPDTNGFEASHLTGSAASARPAVDADDGDEGHNLLAGPRNVQPYIVKRGEQYMNKEQTEHFREILLAWKRDLMVEVDRTVSHMKDEAANFPDPNDRATQEEEFSLELRTRDRERKLIRKIDEALKRIEDGNYGYCLETGEEIGIKRLEARPVATLSVEAQERRERREKQYGDRDDRYR